MSKINIGITNKNQWDDKWKDIFDHYQQDLRHSFYINAFLKDTDKKILEIGAGSFRDVVSLNNLKVNAYGIDFSEKSVQMAKDMYPKLATNFFVGDAFNMSQFHDKEFDVTYHNGFWILFNDDNHIEKLIIEQKRITKNLFIATVQNKNNEDFVKYFDFLSKEDPLYKIRFFSIDEMIKLMSPHFKKIEIIPVGKGKKYFEDEMINNHQCSREQLFNYFNSVGLKHLHNSERLLCIGHI